MQDQSSFFICVAIKQVSLLIHKKRHRPEHQKSTSVAV